MTIYNFIPKYSLRKLPFIKTNKNTHDEKTTFFYSVFCCLNMELFSNHQFL